MKIIAFMNQKGGVGKTTLTRNVGEALAREGFKVLLVDLDHQSNLTLALNVQYILDEEAKEGNATHKDCVVVDFCIGDMFDENFFKAVSISPNLDLLPNEIGFAAKEMTLQSRFSREYILTNILKQSSEVYDYCLVDCPPSFGLVTANALVAAQALIVPVQPSEYAFRGLKTMLKNIAAIRTDTIPSFFRVVLNDYENNTIEGKFAQSRLEDLKNVVVLNTKINHAQAFMQAERKHVSIFDVDNHRAQEQIQSLTKEIMVI